MPEPLSAPPSQFPTNSTVAFTVSQGDYPAADGWTVKWGLAGASAASVTATASGTDWLVTLTVAANTLTPGLYTWVLWAEKGAGPTLEKHEISRGTTTVLTDPFAASANSQQLTDERELALLDAAIAARLSGDVAEYSIGDRSLKKIPLEELLKWRNTVRSRMARRARGGAFGQVKVSFPAFGGLRA
jgi:hypothetical protein